MNDNLEVKEYNIEKIERYQDLIDDIRVRITVDENGLTDEAREVLLESKAEILRLRDYIQNTQEENLKYKKYCGIMARQLYVNHKLMDVKSREARKKIKKLLLTFDDDVKYSDKDDLDRIIKELAND